MVTRREARERARRLRPRPIRPSAEHVEAAKLYLEKAKGLTRWEQFLHALAATHELRSEVEGRIARSLKAIASTPEEARRRCPLPREAAAAIYDTYKKSTVAEAACHAANHWDEVVDAMERCDWGKVVRDVKGFLHKGADMLLLSAGCDTAIPDRLQIKRMYMANFGEVPTEDFVKVCQLDRECYLRFKEVLEKEAEMLGMPKSLYHVATWLALAEGPSRHPRGPKGWVEELFR